MWVIEQSFSRLEFFARAFHCLDRTACVAVEEARERGCIVW